MRNYQIHFFALIIIFWACKKKDEVSPGKTQLLTNNSSKNWRFATMKFNSSRLTESSSSVDSIEFFASGTYKKKGYVYEEGNWKFNSSQDTIFFIIDQSTYSYRVSELLSNSLHLQYRIPQGTGLGSKVENEYVPY